MIDHHRPQSDPSRADFARYPRKSWLELFHELADGRVAAYERLYELAAERLFGLALWHTRSRDDACDVVQETFVRVAEQRRRLLAVKDPRSWLLTVAHRLAVDVLRRRRRMRTEPLESHPLLAAPEVDSGRGADAAAMSRLLATLPAGQRDAIYLKHFADCSFADIGRIAGVPTFTAASRYRNGIRRLRRLTGETS